MLSEILKFISPPVFLYVTVIASVIHWRLNQNSAMLKTLYAERLVAAEERERSLVETIKERERLTIEERERFANVDERLTTIEERERLVAAEAEEHLATAEERLVIIEEHLAEVAVNKQWERLAAIDGDREWRQSTIAEVEKANVYIASLKPPRDDTGDITAYTKQRQNKYRNDSKFREKCDAYFKSLTEISKKRQEAVAAKKCKEDELMYHAWYVEYNKKIEEAKAETIKRFEKMIE